MAPIAVGIWPVLTRLGRLVGRTGFWTRRSSSWPRPLWAVGWRASWIADNKRQQRTSRFVWPERIGL